MIPDKVDSETQKKRFDICLACDKIFMPTHTCKVCKCFMRIKTWMPNAKCPIGKWV